MCRLETNHVAGKQGVLSPVNIKLIVSVLQVIHQSFCPFCFMISSNLRCWLSLPGVHYHIARRSAAICIRSYPGSLSGRFRHFTLQTRPDSRYPTECEIAPMIIKQREQRENWGVAHFSSRPWRQSQFPPALIPLFVACVWDRCSAFPFSPVYELCMRIKIPKH